nr:CorA family divalent cation transporter [Streptococcus canis]
MSVLTIVTTRCSPLTILVGWYGINFKYMPELSVSLAIQQ